jgi:pilus assembly protein Flp/PilA
MWSREPAVTGPSVGLLVPSRGPRTPYAELRTRPPGKLEYRPRPTAPTVFAEAHMDRAKAREHSKGGVRMFLQLYTGLQVWFHDLRTRASEERGATAVEYALMVALIAAVIIVAVRLIGTNAEDKFTDVGNAVGSA